MMKHHIKYSLFLVVAFVSATVFARDPLRDDSLSICEEPVAMSFFDDENPTFSSYVNNYLPPSPNAAAIAKSGIANHANEYEYNSNGSLTKDSNRGINNISYDNLGNPRSITFFGGNMIEYVYAADGQRLRTIHRFNSDQLQLQPFPTADSIDYRGNLVLKQDLPSQYRFEGGYASFIQNRIEDFHYYIQDYMGNNRAVVKTRTSPEQVIHYYPYGGVIGGIGLGANVQDYKFEGKELDRTSGLDNYDIEARQYFAMAPMWDRVDPLCEKYYGISPYAYCGGDPVNRVDKNGNNYTLNFTDSTVIVSATLYATRNDLNEADRAASYWNYLSGDFCLADGRAVVFEIGTETATQQALEQCGGNELNAVKMLATAEKDNGGNLFQVVDELVPNQNGTTTGGFYIRILNSRVGTETAEHEIGHMLGLIHSFSGLMTPDSQNVLRSRNITSSQVETIIVNGVLNMPYPAAGTGTLRNANNIPNIIIIKQK